MEPRREGRSEPWVRTVCSRQGFKVPKFPVSQLPNVHFEIALRVCFAPYLFGSFVLCDSLASWSLGIGAKHRHLHAPATPNDVAAIDAPEQVLVWP